jgi:hypothetical protein
MPRQVVDLFARWSGFFGNPLSAAVRKMLLSCLLSVFEEREMIEVLKTAKRRWWGLSPCYSILFTFGRLRLSFLMCLVFMIFLLCFSV